MTFVLILSKQVVLTVPLGVIESGCYGRRKKAMLYRTKCYMRDETDTKLQLVRLYSLYTEQLFYLR